jgi:hypothetical protein
MECWKAERNEDENTEKFMESKEIINEKTKND